MPGELPCCSRGLGEHFGAKPPINGSSELAARGRLEDGAPRWHHSSGSPARCMSLKDFPISGARSKPPNSLLFSAKFCSQLGFLLTGTRRETYGPVPAATSARCSPSTKAPGRPIPGRASSFLVLLPPRISQGTDYRSPTHSSPEQC